MSFYIDYISDMYSCTAFAFRTTTITWEGSNDQNGNALSRIVSLESAHVLPGLGNFVTELPFKCLTMLWKNTVGGILMAETNFVREVCQALPMLKGGFWRALANDLLTLNRQPSLAYY